MVWVWFGYGPVYESWFRKEHQCCKKWTDLSWFHDRITRRCDTPSDIYIYIFVIYIYVLLMRVFSFQFLIEKVLNILNF